MTVTSSALGLVVECVWVITAGRRVADIAFADVGPHGLGIPLGGGPEASTSTGVELERGAGRNQQAGRLVGLLDAAVWVAHAERVRSRLPAAVQSPRRHPHALPRHRDVEVTKCAVVDINPEAAAVAP